MSFSRTTHRVALALAATLTGLVALSTPAEATTSAGASASTSTFSTLSSFAALSSYTTSYTGVPSMDTSVYEKRVKHWINVRRTNHGLRKVRWNTCSDNYAEKWSYYLAVNSDFYHQDLTPILNNCNAYYVGETLARGMISPRKTVYLWMHSSGHRHILLSKDPNKVGIGATVDSEGRWLVAADFVKVS